MVSGTITSLKGSNGKDNDYGNLYISDGTNELYVYGCYPGWGATGDARKFFIVENGIEVGDRLTMIGYKDTYKNLIELCGGTCFSFAKANAE
jgi:RPA family protein